ncbi:hypothetical protein ACWG8W_06480 [Citricoccus zhacaiensis]
MTDLLLGAMDPDDDNDLRLDWLGDGELLGEPGYQDVRELMKGAGEVFIAVIDKKPVEEWAQSVVQDCPELDAEFSWRYLGGERVLRSDEDGWERIQGVWGPLSEAGWAFRDQFMGLGNRPLTGRERKTVMARERRWEQAKAQWRAEDAEAAKAAGD